MRRVWIVVVLFATQGYSPGAEARAKHGDWAAVERLSANDSITVRMKGNAVPDRCSVVASDDASLTCIAEDGMMTRLVFPRAAVKSVWVAEIAKDHHAGVWIAMAAGAALGAAICSPAGPAAAFLCGGIGASVSILLVTDPANTRPIPYPPYGGYPPPYSAPAPLPQLRMRLIYSAP